MSNLITTELLKKWTDAIKNGDPKQVTDLYHEDAILLGTFSNKERTGHELILEYFENLLKSPVEVEIVSNHPVFEQIEDDDEDDEKGVSCAANSGLYNFVTEGKTINARFSFVYTETNDGWKIVSHHSSVMPET